MPILTTPDPHYAYVHGVALSDKESSAVVACVKHTTTHETALMVLRDPVRPFWVTKKTLRTHKDKRIVANDRELNLSVCPQHKLLEEINRALGNKPRNYYRRNELLDSPYVYGANIDVEVIYKQMMIKKCGGVVVPLRFGILDLETSVLGGREIVLASYTNQEGKTYLSILQSFMPPGATVDDIERKYLSWHSDRATEFNEKALAVFNQLTWTREYHLAKDEPDLLRWIFARIHDDKPDFCGIWNIDYDAPYILARCEVHGIDPIELFCHPDVPVDLRHVKYYPDRPKPNKDGKKKKDEHITDAWHYLATTGYTQFYDAMCLYARTNKLGGRETSYALDYIMTKVLGSGKIKLSGEINHFNMQSGDFVGYAAYCMGDTITPMLAEHIYTNLPNMMLLLEGNRFRDFKHQTVMLGNEFYSFCRRRKLAPGTVGSTTSRPEDEEIVNIGGGVLPPQLARDTGVSVIAESNHRTKLNIGGADIDVRAMYPNLVEGGNVATDTKVAGIVNIAGVEPAKTEDLIGNAVDPHGNAVYVSSTYFGLPSYRGMYDRHRELTEVDLIQSYKYAASLVVTPTWLREHADCIFVYGDNTVHRGKGGAAAMRDEERTYGFVTKRYPNNEDGSFFAPMEYHEVYQHEMLKLIVYIRANPTMTFLVSPVGRNLANRYQIWENVIRPNLLKDLLPYKSQIVLLFNP